MTIEQASATQGLSAAFERLSQHADEWSARRIMDEGLDLIRDSTWADAATLYAAEGDDFVEVAVRPTAPDGVAAELASRSADWFPWGLSPVSPRRFLLVQDAALLPCSPLSPHTLGEIGIASCLHLPILERQRTLGALHLFWCEPRLEWDDDRGRLLRLLGRFLLARGRTDRD